MEMRHHNRTVAGSRRGAPDTPPPALNLPLRRGEKMTKSRCITHPEGSESVVVFKPLTDIASKRAVLLAAAIAQRPRRSLEIPSWLGFSRGALARSTRELIRSGLVSVRSISPEDIKAILCSKTPQPIPISPGSSLVQFRLKCAWCGCITTTLHDHHYPVQKSKGGTETVSICSNCHTEYHVLRGRILVATDSLMATYPNGRYPSEDEL